MVDIYEPPYEEWAAILRSNVQTRAQREVVLGHARTEAIRVGVCELAHEYTASIREAAARCGVAQGAPLSCSTEPNAPIVMGGHQPVVQHPGLLCKVQALARFSHGTQALGVQVVVDTDEGDGGALVWPRVSQGQLELKRASIAVVPEGVALYSEQRVADADTVGRICGEVEADLRGADCLTEAEQMRHVGALYQRLAGERLAVAHSVVRWALADVRVLELPLSVLVQQTELRSVLHEIISDGVRLATTYNETLQQYRREHRIHNVANPFPNLAISPESTELPLWRIDRGRRTPLTITSASGVESRKPAGSVVPRGSMTTLLLRAFCSDLFIHGLGGATYDRFVEQFAEAYLNVTLPPHVVTSRTQHLFPERVKELRRSLELASLVKEMTARTESFLGQGIFSREEELALESLVRERATLRQIVQKAETPEVKSATAHALNAANRAVRQLIEGGSMKQHIAHAAAHEAALARWSFREFPFFLYKLPRSA